MRCGGAGSMVKRNCSVSPCSSRTSTCNPSFDVRMFGDGELSVRAADLLEHRATLVRVAPLQRLRGEVCLRERLDLFGAAAVEGLEVREDAVFARRLRERASVAMRNAMSVRAIFMDRTVGNVGEEVMKRG